MNIHTVTPGIESPLNAVHALLDETLGCKWATWGNDFERVTTAPAAARMQS